VRFRVGVAGAALGVPADALRDFSVPLEELWGSEGRRLSEAVAAAPSVEGALGRLARGLVQPRASLDPHARQAVLLLGTGLAFNQLSRALGYSERQVRRRVERAVGYGPRLLARIVRLQRFLQAVEHDGAASLARLAADTGYADQAHLARECRELTPAAPRRHSERTSESFKAAAAESGMLTS